MVFTTSFCCPQVADKLVIAGWMVSNFMVISPQVLDFSLKTIKANFKGAQGCNHRFTKVIFCKS